MPRSVPARQRVAFAATLALAIGLLPWQTPAASAALPSGFRETVVFSGLATPTAVEFASDGRVFVAEKSGIVKVFDGLTDQSPDVFADLRVNVHDYWDRGLLGLALDPNFPSSPYVYVLYTYDHILGDPNPAPRWGDTCPTPPGSTGDGCVVSGRLSRLQAAGNSMTGGEQVLIEDWCQQYPSHTVGSLAFAPDGALYVSAGDGASFNFADYGQAGGSAGSPTPKNPCGDPPSGVGGTQTTPTAEGGALRSQDLRTTGDPTTLDGAVLRVNPATGAALPTNPLASSADLNSRRIIAYGLRNPFRISVRPGTNEVWLGDVGWSTWEEINRIPNGADSVVENFGWPCYEGAGRQGSYDGLNLSLCENLYAAGGVAAPHYTYRHSDSIVSGEACSNGQGSSTVGTAFYEGGDYPDTYDGALFFADYSRDCLWVMFRGTNGLPDPTKRANFVTPAANPVDLEIGPEGDLFYVDVAGSIRRIEYAVANQPPTAVANATPTSGAAPLTVSFDGSGSTDPEGSTLTYAWDLDNDGSFDDAAVVAPSYTYTSGGTHVARLSVTDTGGGSDVSDPVTISVGRAPEAIIDTPTADTTWQVGDSIGFSGRGVDPDGDAVTLSWALALMHCPTTTADCHEHPLETFDGTSSGSFVTPDHEYPSYLELRLTARDAEGLTDTVVRRLDPRTVTMTLASTPSGLNVSTGGTTQATPLSMVVIVGSENMISAPSPQDANGTRYAWQAWSDGGAQSHQVTAPSSDFTLTASFVGVSADLAVRQTATTGGGRATLTITTRNLGPATASGVTVVDTLPSKFTFVSGSAGCTSNATTRKVTCAVGSIAAGQEAAVSIVVRYKGRGSATNTVTATTSTPDLVTSNNTSTVSIRLR